MAELEQRELCLAFVLKDAHPIWRASLPSWQIIMHYKNFILPSGKKEILPTHSSLLLSIILAKGREVKQPHLSASQEHRSPKSKWQNHREGVQDFWVFIHIICVKTHCKAVYLTNILFLIMKILSYIHWFSKYLLSIYCVPETFLGNGDTAVNKTKSLLTKKKLTF